MAGTAPRGPVLPFDDDHGCLGGVPAEKLRADGYAVTLVTSRLPRDGLYRALADDSEGPESAGIRSVATIGDCLAPSTIAAAVYAGHRAARELDEAPLPHVPFRREIPPIAVSD